MRKQHDFFTFTDVSIESNSCSQAHNNFCKATTAGASNKMSSAYNQSIKFISKCEKQCTQQTGMHLGGTARRIALTAAQCYSFIYK